MRITNWIRRHPLLSFFGIAYAIMFGVMFPSIYLDPSQPMHPWSLRWFLSVFSPSFSALIVGWIIGGLPEVKRLLSGFARWKVGFRWYLAAVSLFLLPLAVALVYRILGHPVPGLAPGITGLGVLGQLVFTLFSGPIAEEMGWRGFALPRLQSKYNALISSLILGVIWCCWHLPFFFLTGSSQQGIPFPIYLVLVVLQTIYSTWLYNNTRGSLIITVLAHFAYNLVGGLILGTLGMMPAMVFFMTGGPLLGVLIVAVVFVFGPKHLSKKPVADLPIQVTKA